MTWPGELVTRRSIGELVEMKLGNERIIVLPDTGGTGIYPAMIAGSMFMALAAILLITRKRRSNAK